MWHMKKNGNSPAGQPPARKQGFPSPNLEQGVRFVKQEISARKSKTVLQQRWPVLVVILVSVLLVITFAQLLAAGEDSQASAESPPQPVATAAFYSQVLSTTAELLLAEPSLERYVAAHSIPAHLLQPADLEDSTKTVAPEETVPGGIVQFTITLVNSGDSDAPTTMTDALPPGLELVSAEAMGSLGVIETSFTAEDDTVTWEGTLGAGRTLTVHVTVRVSDEAEPGEVFTNTAEILDGDSTIERSAAVSVGRNLGSPVQFLPYTTFGLLPDPGPVNLDVGEVNGQNQWTIFWSSALGATAYELEESNTPDFTNATLSTLPASQNALLVQKAASFRNEYFYRIRSRVGDRVGPWSNVDSVVGAYRDDFRDASSGWAVRRTTYIEEVQSFYEIDSTRDWMILRVEDSWDWGITSPRARAPRVPYAIEYEIQYANLGNLVSQGIAFAGDWPGAICPDPSTVEGWYQHELCFNQFYAVNVIFFGPLKLLFERVDELVWCPNCGGSPMKRLGDIDPNSSRQLNGVDPEGWNKFRVEVRADSIKVFAGARGSELRQVVDYGDTRWVASPYFGIFASTDEYSNSTARVEYVQVLPLDN
jgi:uncharacterized repeat protein (TIGR01451 family)